VIGYKQHKKITKQYLITKQTVLKDAAHYYERVSARITKIRATVKTL
jgi:hypothetical protein